MPKRIFALYPTVNGTRMFLIAPAANDDVGQTEQAFETALSDYGFTAERTRDRLAALMAVQNTYLSTFQSLGALGLILGSFGLAVMQLRNVWERRGELALMQALGFRKRRLGWLLLDENLSILLVGLALGVATALVAIAPNLLGGDAGVPWTALLAVLGIVVATGVLVGGWATRVALCAPLVETLREEA
ncbi:MAG: ABC transporter permease [Pirellulales bacterium]